MKGSYLVVDVCLTTTQEEIKVGGQRITVWVELDGHGYFEV